MQTVLPLDKMTREEKLRIMEELWVDLSRDESKFETPEWHAEVLRERAAEFKAGDETFLDWEEVKKQLRGKNK